MRIVKLEEIEIGLELFLTRLYKETPQKKNVKEDIFGFGNYSQRDAQYKQNE